MPENSVKKWEFAIVSCGLIGTLITSIIGVYQGFQSNAKLGLIQVSIQDTEDIRRALAKPLEGVWDYTIKYDKFRGKQGDWEANGTAILMWLPAEERYDVYIGSSLTKTGESYGDQIITWFLKGSLKAHKSGEPKNPFEIKFIYEHRTSSDPKYKTPGSRTVTLKPVKITERNIDNKPTEFIGEFKLRNTHANAVFKKK